MSNENEDTTPLEDGSDIIPLKEQILHMTGINEDIIPFYTAIFPQLDMTEDEQEEFLDNIRKSEIFEAFYDSLVLSYGGEAGLQEAVNYLNRFYDFQAEAFGVVPKALNDFLTTARAIVH
jgi:hypothetical protein